MEDWEKTLLTAEQRTEVLVEIGSDNCDEVIDEAICKHQAKTSYEAGIKTVVDFVLTHRETEFNKHGNVYINPKEWQSFLKEHGIEK